MYRTTFIASHLFLGVLIAYVMPFVAVFRGASFVRTVGTAWVRLLLYMAALCVGIPLLVRIVSPDFTAEVLISWVPEAPGVVAILFVGWMPPLFAASIGLGIRKLILRFWPKAFAASATPTGADH
ncbi:MAG: hypothetical protein EOP84_06350 [Verrucomicrobiaceae bacterium]|nr:MAG: hypothetical protein EOP84_06350 [Verrucomicrobiaceae bacterium]